MRYVHLPGNAVDTALLEDGMLQYCVTLGHGLPYHSDEKRGSEPSHEGEMRAVPSIKQTEAYEMLRR